MSWLFRSAPAGCPQMQPRSTVAWQPSPRRKTSPARPAGSRSSIPKESSRLPAVSSLVGLGPAAELDTDTLRTAAAEVAQKTERVGGSLAWLLDDSLGLSHADQARAVVDGLVLGTYDPGRWKTNASLEPPFERLVLVGSDDDALRESGEQAAKVATAANRARDLANTGANLLTPEKLADRALELAAEHANLSAEALGPDEARELGMGAFSAVGQGSHNPPRMIVLRYEPPSPAGDVLLGLVGKAITFDTGGISIKPALYMEDMKGDMAGGATVIEGLGAIAELGLPLRTLAVVAATENSVGGGAYGPATSSRPLNGKTIEVTNTDAEGRLVLADALWYARQLGATHLSRLRDAHRSDGQRARRPLRRGLRERRRLARRGRRRRRGKRRPRLALAAAPALPRPDRLGVRRHEELLRARTGGADVRRLVPRGVRRRGPLGARRHGRDRLLHLGDGTTTSGRRAERATAFA